MESPKLETVTGGSIDKQLAATYSREDDAIAAAAAEAEAVKCRALASHTDGKPDAG